MLLDILFRRNKDTENNTRPRCGRRRRKRRRDSAGHAFLLTYSDLLVYGTEYGELILANHSRKASFVASVRSGRTLTFTMSCRHFRGLGAHVDGHVTHRKAPREQIFHVDDCHNSAPLYLRARRVRATTVRRARPISGRN